MVYSIRKEYNKKLTKSFGCCTRNIDKELKEIVSV